MIAIEPLLPLAVLQRAEVGPPAGARLVLREAPQHVLAHDVLAVLQDDHRRALVGIDVLDRLILTPLSLEPFRPRCAKEFEVQHERLHFLGAHLVGVEVAHGLDLAALGESRKSNVLVLFSSVKTCRSPVLVAYGGRHGPSQRRRKSFKAQAPVHAPSLSESAASKLQVTSARTAPGACPWPRPRSTRR